MKAKKKLSAIILVVFFLFGYASYLDAQSTRTIINENKEPPKSSVIINPNGSTDVIINQPDKRLNLPQNKSDKSNPYNNIKMHEDPNKVKMYENPNKVKMHKPNSIKQPVRKPQNTNTQNKGKVKAI